MNLKIKDNFHIKLYLIICFIAISCKENPQNKIGNKNITNTENELPMVQGVSYNFIFPDTVQVNTPITGLIMFYSDLDSITTDYEDERNKRYTIYKYATAGGLDHNYEYLKEHAKSIYMAYEKNKIVLDSVSFEQTGLLYIDGIFSDEVIMETDKVDEEGDELVRWIKKEFRIIKEVVVIDSIQTKNELLEKVNKQLDSLERKNIDRKKTINAYIDDTELKK